MNKDYFIENNIFSLKLIGLHLQYYSSGEANSLLRSLMSANGSCNIDETVSSFSPKLHDNGRSVILMREEVLWPPSDVLTNRTNFQQSRQSVSDLFICRYISFIKLF